MELAKSDAESLVQKAFREQLQDPPLRVVHASITASSSAKVAWSEAHRRLSFSHDDYTLHRGRIFYKALDALRRVVPVSRRFALVQAYHRLLPLGGHRGTETRCRKLTRFYHWEGMKGDCNEFVRRCEVCNARTIHSTCT
eukprot:2355985-Pleurochrysis_carterae.AAC.1